MSMRIGIIAEDKSDVEVIDTLLRKMTTKPFKVLDFVGNGCGKIVGKCHAWAQNLRRRGCSALIVVHDLDKKNVATLSRDLATALAPCPIVKFVVVIPVREIEAGLLADETAINTAIAAKSALKRVANPETDPDPKRTLRRLIARASDRQTVYSNTVHNVKIARHASIPKLRRCGSFEPFYKFTRQHLV
jgi:hypothetical protein